MAVPAPTPVTPTTRYIPAGDRRVCFAPTIANPLQPTLAELNAAPELTAEIPLDGVSGFMTTGTDVEVGDYGSRIIGKIPGMTNTDDASITTYASSTGSDSRSLLTDGLNGFVVIYPEGIPTTSGGKMNIFQVRVKDTNVANDSADAAAKVMTGFSIARVYKNVPIPTA